MADGEPAPNAKTLSITVKCLHCKQKFRSPILLSPYSTFKAAKLERNTFQCPACGQTTGCNKENFLALFEGGGHVGNAAM